ncbi:hypothetical protein BJ165DRAFT_1478665 [Panaeolus papilionaceus]|nr:hypothetical protein BJ165DRAFT_1478665 [Panaeolus papilionaceus]
MTTSNYPHFLATAMGLLDHLARLLGINQIKPTDLVFIVIGPSGVGKSSFINKGARRSILKVGHGLETTTKSFSHVLCPSANSQRIVLVDTPPFPLSMQDEKKIKKWMQKSLGRNVTFHGILYLHRITDNRVNENPRTHFNTFQSLVGTRFHSRVALVTTMWDTLRDERIGARREQEIKSGEWQDMVQQGSIIERHHNTPESVHAIIDKMISMSTPSTLGDTIGT